MLSSFWRAAEPAAQPGDADHSDAEHLLTPRGWSPGPFDAAGSVRVLLCYDSSARGKCPLYDSHARLPRPDAAASRHAPGADSAPPPPSHPRTASSTSAGKRTTPRRTLSTQLHSADLKLISEMMFGVLPLTYRGITSKIHYLRYPSEVLVTKMFSFSPSDFHAPGQSLAGDAAAQRGGAGAIGVSGPSTPPPPPPPSQVGSLLTESLMSLTVLAAGGDATAGETSVPTTPAQRRAGPQRVSRGSSGPIGSRPRSSTLSPMSLSPEEVGSELPLLPQSDESSPLVEFSRTAAAAGAGDDAASSVSSSAAVATGQTMVGESGGRRARATSNASEVVYNASGQPIVASSAASTASQTYSARRYLRHRSTSIEHGTFQPAPLPTSVSSVFSNERAGGLASPTQPGGAASAAAQVLQQQLQQQQQWQQQQQQQQQQSPISAHQQSRHRRMQFAVGVVVALDGNRVLRDLLFSHFALIEFRLHKMHDRMANIIRDAVRAGLPPHVLQQPNPSVTTDDIQQLLTPYVYQLSEAMHEQVNEFRDSLRALYFVPRIQEPLWLNYVTFPARRATLSRAFMHEFALLLDATADVKRSTHFLATVLTAVLAAHLAWVPTVAPPPPGASDDTGTAVHHRAAADGDAASASSVAIGRFFPYNPLWAQLCDLYGSIGTPAQLARTIVVGQNVGLVNRLLFILTYFIRCSEVYESLEQLEGPSGRPHSRSHEKRFSDDERDSGNSSKEHDPRGGPGSEGGDDAHAAGHIDLLTLLDTFRTGDDGAAWGTATTTGSRAASVLSQSPHSPLHRDDATLTSPSLRDDARSRGSSKTHTFDEGISRSRQNSHPDEGGSPSRGPSTAANSVYGTSPGARAPSPFATLPARLPYVPMTGEVEAHKTAFEAFLGDEKVEGLREVAMPASAAVRVFPSSHVAPATGPVRYRPELLFCKTYGRSLLGGYCRRYAPDFVLHGLPTLNFMEQLVEDLKLSVKHRILDEPVHRSVCIVADTNEWRCEQISSSTDEVMVIDPITLAPRWSGNESLPDGISISQRVPQPSDFILHTLTSLKGLHDMHVSSEACIMFLEDRLQELYFKSVLLSEYVNEHAAETLTYRSVASKVGLSMSDMPLLVAVASTHHSNIATRFKISEHLFGVMRSGRDFA